MFSGGGEGGGGGGGGRRRRYVIMCVLNATTNKTVMEYLTLRHDEYALGMVA